MTIRKYKNHIIAFFVLGLPFFVELYLSILYKEYHHEIFKYANTRFFIRLSQILTLFLTTFTTYLLTNYKKILILIWALLIYIPAALNAVSVYVSGFLIYEDFMNAIFCTDIKEAILCLKDYAGYIILNLIIIAFAFSLKKMKSVSENKLYRIYAFALFFVSFISMDLISFQNIVSITNEYLADLKEAKEFDKKHVPLEGIKVEMDKNFPQTYVIVIGESVDRKHMSIYGYNRRTTPHFDNLKNELFVFKNVNTAHAFTSGAVKSMFQINLDKQNTQQYTLIHFFKDAGFKTFWFSNQGRFNIFDNYVMRLGKLCDEYAFINNAGINDKSLFDESLLKYFHTAIEDNAKKKLIILHLMGSHTPLNFRYPSNFKRFKLPSKYFDKGKAFCVTLYDNSILYTDHILNEIVCSLKKNNGYSGMLYLSDHGQDINDTKECDLGARKGPNAYEIPFIIWVSDEYRKQNAVFINTWDIKRSYVTDKTAYTIIDLARMKHDSIDLSKSIFSRQNDKD